MPLVPDYAPVTGPRVARGLYGWVLLCAIAPMVTGVGILLLYVIVRHERLPEAGLYCLGIGFALVLIGFGLLAWYSRQQSRVNLMGHDVLHARIRQAIWLLLANFAVAAICAVLGVREMRRQFFTVTNASVSTMQDVRIVLPDGRELRFDDVQPQQSRRQSVVRYEVGGWIICSEAKVFAEVNGRSVEQRMYWWEFHSSARTAERITFNGDTFFAY